MKSAWRVAAALFLLVPAADAAEDKALQRARKLLRKAILIDGHNDLPWAIRQYEKAPHDVVAYDLRQRTDGQTDIARLRAGGVGGQFWSVYVPADVGPHGPLDHLRVQLEQIDIARQVVDRYPDVLALALTSEDVKRQFKRRRIASLLGIEGGHVIGNSLGALRAYYDLGVRYMTLTHGRTIDWADSATDEPRHGGLTRFGEEVVREMNRLGMLVDLSHVAPDTMDDALRVSEAPIIFSHSSTRALCDHPRNVPDDVLKQLPRNGGLVMITFVPSFVSQEVASVTIPLYTEYRKRTEGITDAAERDRIQKEVFTGVTVPLATIGQVADHVEHVRKMAGVDHVGLGGDYDGNDRWPTGLEDVSTYPQLFAELIRRGWTDQDLKKLAGENLLRAFRRAEEVSKRLRSSRAASTATIQQLDTPAAP